MSDYSQGGIAHLQAEFLDHPQGQPIDPTAISLSIVQGATTIAGPFTYPTQIVRDLVGLYHYDWSVPATQALGAYTAVWTATVNGTQGTGYENFNIVVGFAIITGNPDGWATPADVVTITGVTGVAVTDALVIQANAVIEMHAGRTYATAKATTGTRDAEWMKRAVAYQAAWMLSQPDMFTRLEMEAISATGRPVPIRESALTLAPLARRALKRVSWLKSRSVHVRSQWQDGMSPISSDPDSAGNDFYESFSPMAGGW